MINLFADYAIFALLIIATFAFNIYYNVSGPKEKTKADYVFASGPSVSTWAMLLSIARGFLGVRVFLGYPSELFYRGSGMWETMYGMCLAFPVVAYMFVPMYFNLGITSVYQYLDLRFKSRLVRRLASGTYVARSILNLGVTVFTPCVALKTLIGMPYWMSIVTISAIGVFFSILGGLRSAIMADVIQGLAMIVISITVVIHGSMIADGGVQTVVTKSYERGRLDFFDFDLDPTRRVSTVSALVGQFFISLSMYGCQQNFVQRYLSMKTKEKVIRTLWYNVPFMALLMSLSWIVGMVIFVHYADCDPKQLGYIKDIDEILPFYIEDKFVFLPGFLGLTMACLFNGALSFLVSNMNSMSTVLWEDFVAHLPSMKNLNDTKQIYVIKILSIGLGICVMGVAFAVSHFDGVIESSMLMTSATSGPLLGVFLLAAFVPIANWKGASVGMIASHVITLWVTFGAFTIDKPPVKYLPTSTEECTNTTFSQHISPLRLADAQSRLSAAVSLHLTSTNTNRTIYEYESYNKNTTPTDTQIDDDYTTSTSTSILTEWPPVDDDLQVQPFEMKIDQQYSAFPTSLYKMTYMYYALFGTLITVVVGTVVSYVTGTSETYRYSHSLLNPLARKLCVWLPGNTSCFEMDSTRRKNISNVSEKVDFQNKKIIGMSLITLNERHLSAKANRHADNIKNDVKDTRS